MAYGQVMACLLKLTPRNMFIALEKSCGKSSCSYLLLYIKGTFVFTSYTLSPLVTFQNLGFGIWNSALNNSWIPGTITEFWNPSFTNQQVIRAIQNPRLSWTTLHRLSLRFQGWDLILSPCGIETYFEDPYVILHLGSLWIVIQTPYLILWFPSGLLWFRNCKVT